MKIPNSETIRMSAVAHLRELHSMAEADILSRSQLEIGDQAQQYAGTTELGLNLTLRCRTSDLGKLIDKSTVWGGYTVQYSTIREAIKAVLPVQCTIHDLAARSLLVDRNEFEKTELERELDAQSALMIAVATGGPRIQTKNEEYVERRQSIQRRLQEIGRTDPNPFEDLWAWYGRWSSGDLPSYQSRREYVKNLYRGLLEDIVGGESPSPAAPRAEPTGWDKVDRVVDRIVSDLAKAAEPEQFQAVGLLCRECLISLSQAVFDPNKHKSADGIRPSSTDAYRMLEAYFSSEFSGGSNEALRSHAKASLKLANDLQHRRTAQYRDAALCAEATRTLVNIVVIVSGRR